jgi:hypothetical protein
MYRDTYNSRIYHPKIDNSLFKNKILLVLMIDLETKGLEIMNPEQ